MRLRGNNLNKSIVEIAKLISENTNLRREFLNGNIRLFESSNSFSDAVYRSNQLNLFKGYTLSQVNAVLQAAIGNDQIFKSWSAHKEIDQFIINNERITNKNLVRSYKAIRS